MKQSGQLYQVVMGSDPAVASFFKFFLNFTCLDALMWVNNFAFDKESFSMQGILLEKIYEWQNDI